MISEELGKCVEFIHEIEKLKVVYRQNSVLGNARNENSAEHSWHIALMAVVLRGYADDPNVDVAKVIQMLLIHDIVEIDVGDTFLYDAESNESKYAREKAAARRIFGLLPEAIGRELLGLWEEFEGMETAEAKYARAIDSLQPLMNHLLTRNPKYLRHQVKTAQVLEKKRHIAEASKELWGLAQDIIQASEKVGLYVKAET